MQLPERYLARAAAVAYADGTWAPPGARDAATVCLLREGSAGFEVFLMRRPATMRFAPGMHVFPGGSVEAPDLDLPFVPDADLAALGRRAATTAPRALLAAAVRETFEECGVLLAVDRGGRPATGWASLAQDRAAVDEGRLGLGELLRMRRLALDPRLVPLVGHWITPEVVERRFDTRFFVAALPAGQQAGEFGSESDGSGWWTPAAAVADAGTGALPMLAPTLASLRWLATYDTAAAVLAGAEELAVRPLLPRPVPDGAGGVRWLMTDGRTGAELAPADTAVMAATEGMSAADAAGVPGPGVPGGWVPGADASGGR